MMERLSGERPVLWGPSIVGFGRCRYKYESGREGEMPRIISRSPCPPDTAEQCGALFTC